MRKLFPFLLLFVFTTQAFAQLITIDAGKPVILVVSVFKPEAKDKDDFFAKREFAELQKNFPDYDVRLIDKTCQVLFSNDKKEIINYDSDNPKASFESVVFWDGKATSPIKTNKTRVKITEYISELTGQKWVSSYLAENQKIMDKVAKRRTVSNPDKNSKALTQHYIIDMYFTKMCYGKIEYPGLTQQDYKKVKSVIVYSKLNEDGVESKAFFMKFNDKHLVSNIEYFKRPESDGSAKFAFTYDNNGLLQKMVVDDNFDNKPETTTYNFGYDKDRIIESSADQITEFTIQNNILLSVDHYQYVKYDSDFRVESSHDEIKDGCKFSYEEDQITKSYCPSGFGAELPYNYTYRTYENNEAVREGTSKLDKGDGNTLVLSAYVSALKQYKEVGTITLNEKGLTQGTTTLSRAQKYVLRYEYEYFD